MGAVVGGLKAPTMGEAVATVMGEAVEEAVEVVGGIVKGTAAVVGVGVSVGDGCVVVVVVVAAVGGEGVRFLPGDGLVGVGGLNLTMERCECTKRGGGGGGHKTTTTTTTKRRGKQN